MSFDYSDAAELFVAGGRHTGRQTGFRGFATAAFALQYAIEELAPDRLSASVLEVNDVVFNDGEMRALYDAPDYPLPRKLPDIGHANDNRSSEPVPPAGESE